jgi:hypothetical protein
MADREKESENPIALKKKEKDGKKEVRSPVAAQAKNKLNQELDILERQVEDLRILYEQYFIDILPFEPEKENKEVQKFIRKMLAAPFKNSVIQFRLRTIVTRYQTYATYWNRVKKQREAGTYKKDLFKAKFRTQMAVQKKHSASKEGRAEKGVNQLFRSYQEAIKKVGGDPATVNFDAFKKSLVARAKQLKKEDPSAKIQYQVVIKDGRAVVKAGKKDSSS